VTWEGSKEMGILPMILAFLRAVFAGRVPWPPRTCCVDSNGASCSGPFHAPSSAQDQTATARHAMDLRAERSEACAFADYQNESLVPGDTGELLTFEQVGAKAPGRPGALCCTGLTSTWMFTTSCRRKCLCGFSTIACLVVVCGCIGRAGCVVSDAGGRRAGQAGCRRGSPRRTAAW